MKNNKILSFLNKEKLMQGVFFISAVFSIAAVFLICLFLFVNGIPAFSEIGVFNFLTGLDWSPGNVPQSFGIFPMIIGSLYVTAGAVIVGVPLGLFTAVFLARFCPPKIYKIVKPGVELLAGIPSVIYGFFGIAVLVYFFGNSVLTASLLLGIMILPTIINISEAAIRAVPEYYFDGALGLGASKVRAVFMAELPAAKSGILASVVLGIGRAIGETMAVIMVAGNWPVIPGSLFDGVRTMTANIAMDMGYAERGGLHERALIATGVVLFVFIMIINLSFAAITSNKKKKR